MILGSLVCVLLFVLVAVVVSVVVIIFFPDEVFVCKPGECVVDIQTGKKTCSSLSSPTTVRYNPQTQVCSPSNACTSSPMIFSVQPDGSTSATGLCANGDDGCDCFSSLRCARGISSVFSGSQQLPQSVSRDFFADPVTVESSGQGCSIRGYDLPSITSLPSSLCATGTPSVLLSDTDTVGILSAASVIGCVQVPPCEGSLISFFAPRTGVQTCSALM